MPALALQIETERLAALDRYGVLDTLPDASFDRLTRMAARAFSVPISLISLIDDKRQFLKSRHGLDLTETPREHAFCAHALLSDDVITILDVATDERFTDNPLVVKPPYIRFYAAAPLIAPDGLRLGALCVLDNKPRESVSADLLALLRDLADEVIELMEFHRQKQSLVDISQRLVLQSRNLESSRRELDRWQRRAHLALEAGNMGYWERDAETDIITFSPQLEAMLDMDHDQYDGSVDAWLQHVHPDDRQLLRDNIQRARITGTNYTLKYRPLCKDGSERWLTTTGTYRKDAAGRFAGAHGVSWDSTIADLAAHKLKLSEELFRVLSNSAPIGIFRSDAQHRTIYVNPALASFHGVPEAELLDDKWLRFVHPEDRARLFDTVQKPARDERASDHEYRLLLPHGIVRRMHARAVPLYDESGRFIGTVGTVDDVTDQHRLVEDLRKAKENAEVANRAKDMFLANVSHELRTPLNGVLGMSDLLLDAGLNAEQFEMAEIVRESARGLLSVVNDMLDLSRIESGRFSIEYQPFDLRTTVHQTISLFQAEARKQSITFRFEYAEGLPDRYLGDAGRIRQILTNYVSNALKFGNSGEVGIHASGEVEAGAADITLSVVDHGHGIALHDQVKLFRPFSQVDSSTTRKMGGAGLGLAICKRLAELMHGSVGVQSSPGEGSTFWLRLPLVCQPACLTPVSNDVQVSRRPNKQRVLLVEDNPVNQKVAVGVLRKLGWEADVAANGVTAIDLRKLNNYSIILMDCQMPEMDGYAATRQIRGWENDTGRPGIPIIALTAHAMSGNRERCLEAGMNDHLTKPFGLEELRAALDRWTNQAIP